jgi:hypothetical protein
MMDGVIWLSNGHGHIISGYLFYVEIWQYLARKKTKKKDW